MPSVFFLFFSFFFKTLGDFVLPQKMTILKADDIRCSVCSVHVNNKTPRELCGKFAGNLEKKKELLKEGPEK